MAHLGASAPANLSKAGLPQPLLSRRVGCFAVFLSPPTLIIRHLLIATEALIVHVFPYADFLLCPASAGPPTEAKRVAVRESLGAWLGAAGVHDVGSRAGRGTGECRCDPQAARILLDALLLATSSTPPGSPSACRLRGMGARPFLNLWLVESSCTPFLRLLPTCSYDFL